MPIIVPGEWSISELFSRKLTIPHFQRPYEWPEVLVEGLIEDLFKAYEKNSSGKYLLGKMILLIEPCEDDENEKCFVKCNKIVQENGKDTIIESICKDIECDQQNNDQLCLFCNDRSYLLKVIDGQQRIITLALILNQLMEWANSMVSKEKRACQDVLKAINFEIEDNFSIAEIVKKRQFIEKRIKLLPLGKNQTDFIGFICKFVKFTYILTDDLDQAFFLFDAQNARGKPLATKDLLKVHHYRFMPEASRDDMMVLWESFERWQGYEEESMRKGKYPLEDLLDLLTLIRKAIRNELEDVDVIDPNEYLEFKAKIENHYHLSNYEQPPFFKDISYIIQSFKKGDGNILPKSKEFDFVIIPGDFNLKDSWRYIPYHINHDIEGGEYFLYYVIKYFKLFMELNKDENEIFNLWKDTWEGNFYLEKYYQAVLLLYYDKFGREKFEEFAALVVILLVYFRINMDSISKRGIVKQQFLSNNKELRLITEVFLSTSFDVLIKKLKKVILDELDFTAFNGDDKKEKKNCLNYFLKKDKENNCNSGAKRTVIRMLHDNKRISDLVIGFLKELNKIN